MASLRLAIPRSGFGLHSKQLQMVRFRPSIRHASSTTPPPKPRVLEKPDKFRPPSHPSRLRSKPKYNYGPDITQEQRVKRYPHMMPPEGSFMYNFLTNRYIHVWISMSILVSLVFGVWLSDFLNNTPYRDLLPPNSMFWAHPFHFIGRWIEVYNMHIAYVSAQTAEMRKQKVEDVKKRSEYRKAHGIEESEGVFGGWTARGDNDATSPAAREGDVDFSKEGQAAVLNAGDAVGQAETYVDFEGKEQPAKKKWFGIW